MATVLSAEQLASALAELPGWSGNPGGISRTVTAPTFLDGIRLVDAVADSEACAAIMIHAADRYGAVDLPELATMAGIRVSQLQQPLAAAG